MKTHALPVADPNLPPAYLANGLIGLRVRQLPLTGGTALVNGLICRSLDRGSDEYAAAPYPVGADIAIDDHWLSEMPGSVVFDEQQYDFSCGELRSRFRFHIGEITATVESAVWCNRRQPAIVQQETRVQVNAPCKLMLQAHIDPRGLPGQLRQGWHTKRLAHALLEWAPVGDFGSVGAAYIASCESDDLRKEMRNDFGHERDRFLTRYAIDARAETPYVLRQMGALVPSLMHGEPHLQAYRMVNHAEWHGFERLRELNRQAWAELWQSRVRLVGAEARWQELVDASFFYLHSSVSASSPCSVAPFGLSQARGYSGHVFWDTESFMLPAVLLSAPATARAMLEYRCDRIGMARCNAQLNGNAGIQFPWQSGNHGYEVSSYWCEGQGELHINVDIAFAIMQYVNATGDDVFFRTKAWPIVEGIANWLVSIAEKTARGYEIRHVVGIAENYPNVHNNSTLNLLGVKVLRIATAWAGRLGVRAPAAWRKVADGMVAPLDPTGTFLLPHDGYVYDGSGARSWGIGSGKEYCVEAMMMHFPFEQSVTPAIDQATLAHYLPWLHTYVGMPMMSANCVVWACRGGERALAMELLEGGYPTRLIAPYLMLGENKGHRMDCDNENFVTCQGGLISALLYGLGGLNLEPDDPAEWPRHPITLPAGWEAIEVDRLIVRGEEMTLRARHGAAKAELLPAE